MALVTYPSQTVRRGRFKVWPLVLFALFAAFYYTGHSETVPITGRSQLIDISPEQEAALGVQSYSAVLQQSDVIEGGPSVDQLRRVGSRIAAATGRDDLKWEFNLIRSDEANAFALPGGKVAVYTGILPIAQNDDGLAVILGHEVAHATARHGAERLAHERLAQYGALAMQMATNDMEVGKQRAILAALGVGTQFGVLLPFSRSHESEADYIGLHYLAQACFDPREAPRVWERMNRATRSGRAPEFVSTHPNPETRMAQFREWLPEAVALHDQHCGASSAEATE